MEWWNFDKLYKITFSSLGVSNIKYESDEKVYQSFAPSFLARKEGSFPKSQLASFGKPHNLIYRLNCLLYHEIIS